MADIFVKIEDSQPINVQVSTGTPINVKLADAVNVYTGGAVQSVNTKQGDVVLDPDDLDDTITVNKFVTAADITKLANTTGVNTGDQDISGIGANTTSISNHVSNTNNPHSVTKAQVGLSSVPNTDFTSAVALNTAKVGITAGQASAITANTAKNSYPSGDSTKVGHITVTQAVNLDTMESNIATNNAKVGITPTQTANIVTNNSKVGITPAQASDIVTNNAKVGITGTQASDITANNAKISYTDAAAVTANTAKVSFDSTSSTRLADTSGTNTGDNATNTQYSGLAASKQDTITVGTTAPVSPATNDLWVDTN